MTDIEHPFRKVIWTPAREFQPGDVIIAHSGTGPKLKVIATIETDQERRAGDGSATVSWVGDPERIRYSGQPDSPVCFERYEPEGVIEIRTVAALKRTMRKGRKILMRNHVHPELSGIRSVITAQTKRWELSFPTGHRKEGLHRGSWLDIPKASECTFNVSSVVVLRDPSWGDLTPFCSISVLED